MNFKLNRLMLCAMAVGVSLLFAAPSHAQITNNGAGASSSNSTVGLTASVPSALVVNVNGGTSTISATIPIANIGSSSNVAGTDFTIAGTVSSNDSTKTVSAQLSATDLVLTGPSSAQIHVNITGTIGGTSFTDTSSHAITMTSGVATIALTGDVDDSTVTWAKPAGDYTGTLTITASQV